MAAAEKTIDEEAESEEISGGISELGAFISPAAIIMFPIAIFLDAVGIILVCFGLDDFYITDLIGIVFIGGWTYFHSQTAKVTRGAARRMTKAIKWAKRIKWLRPLLIVLEFIPYVGVLPCWTLVVYFELKYV